MLSELLGPALAGTAQFAPPGLFDGVVADQYADLARGVLGFAVAAAVTYSLGRLVAVPLAVRVVAARNRNNPTIASAARTYVHALVIVIAGLVGIAGAGLWSLLTNLSIVVAALTLVVGAASQDVVGSLTSGLFLVADPDFNVGDWIAWPGGEGIVEEIDFRVTRVRTPNNETITVPNTELTANALTRRTGEIDTASSSPSRSVTTTTPSGRCGNSSKSLATTTGCWRIRHRRRRSRSWGRDPSGSARSSGSETRWTSIWSRSGPISDGE